MSLTGWLAAATAVVISGSIGYAGGMDEAKKQEPSPTAAPQTRTVTETVEVEVAPEECVAAIDHAREGFDISSRFADVISKFLIAASELDVDTMGTYQARIAPLTREMTELAPKFNSNAEACEAARP